MSIGTQAMDTKILEQALEDLKEYFIPYQLSPLEWAIIRTGCGSSNYGLALSIALIPAACSPDAIAQLTGAIIETLAEGIKSRSLVGFQIIIGTEIEGQIER